MPHMQTSGITDWTPDELPDLANKLFVITGGNSGIGFEAAKILASHNANVVIAVRNEQKGRKALAKLVNCGSGRCEMIALDLADTASIRAAAAEARDRFGPIHALVNNAGIMQTPKQETADGFEMQLGTNHLGHFLWTALMFDRLDPQEGRVVTVASIAHKMGSINFDNLMMERGYDSSRAYSRSKLANLVFSMELHRRLRAAGSPIEAVACHPGYSDTALQSTGPAGILKAVYKVTNKLMAQPARLGAYPTVLAAADERAVSGGYYGPTGIFDARGPVGDASATRSALDEETGRKLWEVSEDLVGERFAI